MRAARRYRYGGPEVIQIENVEDPTPGPRELLVRVRAATVSRTDCALLAAKPPVMRLMTGLRVPKQPTLGTDFAGEIEAVGADAHEFRLGDRVWGINDMGLGSHAELMVVSADDAVRIMPERIGFDDAVACIEGGWYAYSIIERVGGVRGARVLIYGATGAIGSALLQLCAHDAESVTAVGNAKNLELLRSLGAANVIDYEARDFTRDAVHYDYVFDAVGRSSFGQCKSLLASQGTYVSTELGPGWQNTYLPLLKPWLGGKRVVFPLPVDRKRWLTALWPLVAEHKLRSVIDRSYALDDIAQAYAFAASGQKTGCLIVKPNG